MSTVSLTGKLVNRLVTSSEAMSTDGGTPLTLSMNWSVDSMENSLGMYLISQSFNDLAIS